MAGMEDDPIVRVRIRGANGSVYRAGRCTPYFAETVIADLWRRRGRVEVVVRGDPVAVTPLRDRLGVLDRPAIRVVYRQTRPTVSAA